MHKKLMTKPWISKLEIRKVVLATTLTPHINTDPLYSIIQIVDRVYVNVMLGLGKPRCSCAVLLFCNPAFMWPLWGHTQGWSQFPWLHSQHRANRHSQLAFMRPASIISVHLMWRGRGVSLFCGKYSTDSDTQNIRSWEKGTRPPRMCSTKLEEAEV